MLYMNTEENEFKNNIKEWVALDNKHKQINENSKIIREQKHRLLEQINYHVSEKQLNNAVVKISDGKLKFTSVKYTKPLTLRYIVECLQSVIKTNDTLIEEIIRYIKDNREEKQDETRT